MADKIEFIIEHPDDAKQIIANGLLSSKKYDEAPVMKKWKELFNQLA